MWKSCAAALALGLLSLLGFEPAFAQTPPAGDARAQPAFLIVTGRTLDRAQMGAYAAALRPIYAKNGGRYVGFGGPGRGVVCKAGPCEGRSAVIVQFPDAETLEAFWWGPDYRAAIKLRDRAGVFTVVGLKGVAPAFPSPSGGVALIALSKAAGAKETAKLTQALETAGGRVLASVGEDYSALEGDPPYGAYLLAGFPSLEARAAFFASAAGRRLIKGADRLVLTADAPAQG